MFSLDNKSVSLDKYRYELKIPLEKAQSTNFMHALKQLGLYPVEAFPKRQINSVYFDTHLLDDYVDNVSGVANRCKTRLRWYNENISSLTLEFKIKRNKASYKEALKITNPKNYDPRDYRHTRNIFHNHRTATEYFMLQDVKPVLEVQYQREYYMLGKDLRMTLDLEQKFRRLDPRPAQNLVSSPVYCVVEFKFPASKRLMMQSLMRQLPYRVFRHSKYVIGMDTVAA